MPLISIAPWLDSELAFVADGGLWDGHCFALVAGNRYKAQLRNTAILRSAKNALVPMCWGMKFGYWVYSSHFYWSFGVSQSHFY